MIPVRAYIALGLMALGGLAVWYVMDLRADLAECRTTVDGQAERIREQNKAVAALGEQGEQNKAELTAALEQGAKDRTAADAAVAARRLKKAPASCDAAMAETDKE